MLFLSGKAWKKHYIKGPMSWPFLLIIIPLLRYTRIDLHCSMFLNHIDFLIHLCIVCVFTLCPTRRAGLAAPPFEARGADSVSWITGVVSWSARQRDTAELSLSQAVSVCGDPRSRGWENIRLSECVCVCVRSSTDWSIWSALRHYDQEEKNGK